MDGKIPKSDELIIEVDWYLGYHEESTVTGLMNCPETALFSCPSTAQYRVQELAVLTGRVILPVFSVTPDNHLLH